MPAIFHVSSQIDRGSAYCFGACSVSLTVCLLSKLTSSFTRVLLFFLSFASGEKSILIKKSLACTSITCSLCKARIGGDSHDARYCCEKSSKVFPNASRVDRPAKKRNTGKGRKPGAGRGKSSSSSSSSSRPNHTPLSKPFSYDTHGEAVKDVPKDVIAAMVTLNRYHKAGGASERRAASAEENSSSK